MGQFKIAQKGELLAMIWKDRKVLSIGMLPTIPLDRVKIIGNAAGTGARMMLVSTHSRARAEELAHKIEYLELTIYPDFAMFYARGIQA